ncbi:hypothetical protein EBI00_13875 [Marinomonas hwangdonensis]|uniref:Glycosyltransferase family 1 protein n=1 Tax=Marinomonas hwangdonensis TaxID=1053647 RepID=A0A3M8PZN9_9GAMM|nr:hypothetical protein [Marinomonas hwangdonensis]RNF48801.1 hypothetical protein EBI00_13875 [Marinomonas hwangdonensis]
MIRSVFLNGIFFVQKLLFNISLCFFRVFSWKEKNGIIVGVEEIASILYSLGSALEGSKTVNLCKNLYYNENYDYYVGKYRYSKVFRYLISPILFGYLINKFKVFIYISGNGFLIPHIDGREYEFKKLKQNDCKIICYFTGSDIRSFKLLNEFGKKHGMDVITTFQPISHRGIDSKEKENVRFMLGQAADNYASAIFNPSTDQMAYISRSCYPFLYFADEKKIKYFPNKFKQERKVVLHAPSSPIIKGTPLVRSAVKQLKEEGYNFDYIELIGVSNEVVMEQLAKAHIVLNEFYALVPGVFGVEAMMNNAALLTSANMELETSLFVGANDAWVVTPYWLVYKNLKAALDAPMEILKDQADAGTRWVEQYCTYSFSAKYLNKVLEEIDD